MLQLTPWRALVTELKFVILCSSTTKPVRQPHSPSESMKGSFLDLNVFDNKFNNKDDSEPRKEPIIPAEWVSDLRPSVK